jgi:hypothetical protein
MKKNLLIFFILPLLTFGQITQPNGWTKAYDLTTLSGTGTNFSIAAGTNRILVVGVTSTFDDNGGSGTQADPTISYGGVTLTKATGDGLTSGRMHTWLYFLKDNAVMNATSRPLNVTGGTVSSATLANMTVWYAVFAGVDQTPASYTIGNGFNNSSPSGATAALSSAMAVNTNEQGVYISNIYNEINSTTPSYTINSNWTNGGNNTGTNTSGGGPGVTVAWKVQVANRSIPISNTTDAATTSAITPSGSIRFAMSAMSLPRAVGCATYSITSVSVPTSQCLSTATVTVNGTAVGLPVGTYTVTYNRNDPSATGLTATMNVTTAGTGTFTATGLTNPDNTGTTITVTNLASGSCSNAISSGNVSNNFVMRDVLSVPTGLNGYDSGSCTSYTMQWTNGSPRVSNYYLDVSTDSLFGSFVAGYNNKDLGTSFSQFISGLTSGIPYYWRVRASNACGTTVSTSVQTFTVGSAVGAISANQTICTGSSPTDITIASATGVVQWQRADDSGFTVNLTNLGSNSTTLTSAQIGTLTATKYFRAVVTNGSCSSTVTSSSVTITVSPTTVGGTVTGGTTICSGSTSALLTLAGHTGTVSKWQSSVSPFSTWTDIVNTATTYTSLALTATTQFRAVVQSGSCLVANSATTTVTVRPVFTTGAIVSTGETICYNGDPSVIGSTTAASGGDNTITYKWQANGVDIASSNLATYDPPAGLIATTTYTRFAKDNTCNTTFTVSTGSWIVTVRPNFTTGTIASTGETICYSGNPSVIGSTTAASGGDNAITYKWQANGVDIASSNLATYDPPAGLIATTTYTRFAKDNTCNATFTVSTGSWIVTVRPVFTTGAIVSTGETICYNGDPSVIGSTTAASGGDNTITYKWQANGVDIASSNLATYDPPTGLIATTTYTRFAKDNTCNTTFTVSTGSWIVTVTPNFTTGTIASTGQTICYNGDPSVIGSTTAASGGDNTITYKWQANGVDIASSNLATYDPPAGLIATTTYTRFAKDNTCNTTFTVSTGSWIVTVRPNFTTGTIASTGETICYSGNPSVIGSTTAASGGDNAITYKWQANGVDIASSNLATYDPPAGLIATTTYTRFAKDNTCNATFTVSTGSWIVTVRPVFTTGAIVSTGETICYNGDPSLIGSTTAASGGDNTITYKWQANGVDIASSNLATYDPPAGLIATTTYTRFAKDNTCNTTFTVSTGSWLVTVNPATAITSQSTPTQTKCLNSAFNPIVINTVTGTAPFTYQWYSNSLNNNTTGTPLGSANGAQTNSYTPDSTVAGTLYYYCIVTGTCGSATSAVSGAHIVNPLPNVTITANYCAVPGKIQLTAGGGGTYLWSTGQTINPIEVDVAGVYTVTATLASGCSATATLVVANELVTDGSFTNFNAATPSFTTEYTQNQGYYIGSGVNSTGLMLEGTYAVNTSAYGPDPSASPGTGYHIYFHGRDHTNNATGARNFLMVNGSTTTITDPSSGLVRQKIIWQQTVTVMPGTDYYFSAWAMNLNSSSPAKLQFEVNGVLVGSVADLTTAPKPANESEVNLSNWVRFYSTPTWNSGTATTAIIRIRNLNTAAGGNDFALDDVSFGTLAVVPFTISPTGNSGSNTTLCAGETFNLSPNITNGKAPITYSWTGPNGFTSNLANPSISNVTAANAGTYTVTVNDGYGCTPKTGTVTLTVTALPATPIVALPTQPNCITPTGSVVVSGLPASGSWTLNRSGTSSATTSGTGTGITVSNLAVGSYTFTVTQGCTSLVSQTVTITPVSTKTWGGSSWSPAGNPTANDNIIFTGNYSLTTDVTACSCTVNSGAVVTIPTGKYLKLQGQLTVNAPGTLTFENNSSLVQTSSFTGANIGSITYKRATTTSREFDYTYWSSPVAGQNLLAVSPSTKLDKFYSFDATADYWLQEDPSTTTMAIGKGYIIRGIPLPIPTPPGFYEASFKGNPNNGTIPIAVLGGVKSYLLGNPYPSAIYADQFIFDNKLVIDGTIYLWTHNTPIAIGTPDPGTGEWAYSGNDYASYNLTGGVGTGSGTVAISGNTKPTGFIAAGQSFFTTSTAAGGTVTFTNTMRVNGLGNPLDNSNFYKTKSPKNKTVSTIEKNRIWLNLTNKQGAFKQTLVGYITGATNTWDSLYDGESFDGNDFLDFYSINEDKNLTIQGRGLPFNENDTIPLGYRIAVDGTFTLNIDETDGVLVNQPVFIEDKLTNTIVDLKSGNYVFNTVAGTFNDRFVLRFTDKTLSVDDVVEENNGIITLYSNNTQSLIIRNNLKDVTINGVTLFNLTGQKIAKWDVNDEEQTNIQIPIKNVASEIYVVKIKTTGGEFSKKIIIK